ncbi:hypothetical protein [Brevundimonas sp. SH203]|uniref:hypothetical protein n=1 Tax=Brevundimonas sp. SH203 TaxID=345167 RepID=UPI001178AA7F|nr:hypothetical protein [Brevundimonas sp. SH203]
MIQILAAIALMSTPDVPPPTGACVWSRLPEAEQQAVVAAYDRSMSQAMRTLAQRSANLLAISQDCTGRSDLPPRWIQAAIASHVIQLGASARVEGEKGLSRARLDRAWDEASEAARSCVFNNAAKPFGIEGPACPDQRAGATFLASLGLSTANRADRVAAEQALIYMNAKAQQMIADQLISKAPVRP